MKQKMSKLDDGIKKSKQLACQKYQTMKDKMGIVRNNFNDNYSTIEY